MEEKQILDRIGVLVEEERRLRRKAQSGDLGTEEEQARLHALEASLDQCWDLLRHRRALSEAGQNPDEAEQRSVEQVENYLQ